MFTNSGSWRSGAAVLLLLTAACGARSVERQGGESHFLRACVDDCGGGLTCIDRVCTNPCGSDANCTALAASATCVERAPSRAVCDVECSGDGACDFLGGDASCVDGLCRAGITPVSTDAATEVASTGLDVSNAPELDAATTTVPSSPTTDDPTPSSSWPEPVSSAAQSTDLDGGGASPQGCRYAYVEYDEGDDVPAGECTTCTCQGGEIVCGPAQELPCPGLPVQECPEDELPSDPIDVHFSYIDDYTLTLDVSHSAGCARHDYSICYEPWFLESDPLQARLRLTHDAHGDTCEALGGGQLRFDLRQLAAAVEETYPNTPVVLVTRFFGTLAPGPLSCEDQQAAVNYQLQHVIGQLDLSCVSDEECDKVPVATDCFQTCDQVVSTRESHRLQGEGNGLSSMALLQREVARINDSVCSAYAEECGDPATGPLCWIDSCNPTCNNDRVPRCIDSVCQLSDE